MHISWFTVIAQILNFLILVWLLHRYLYKPILHAIDEREKKIAAQLADAEAKKTEAKKEQDEFKQKNIEFDQQKAALMAKAIAETNDEHQKLLENARNDAAALRVKLQKQMTEAEQSMSHEIAEKVQQQVFAVARKTLADLTSMSLEEQSVNIFLKRLTELNEEDKKQFIAAFKVAARPVLVNSAFELPQKLQGEIQAAVNAVLGTTTPLEFKTAPELIGGIELVTNGYKLAWSISEYLDSLQKSITETMNEKPEEEITKK